MNSTDIYDITILGLGAMGSGSFYHAAKAGKKVLGIEQFDIAHSKGSSHGETRIIREAYHEGPFYVPMVKRSAVLWEQLEKESGVSLYQKIGCLMVAKKDQKTFLHSKLSADKYNLPYKIYNSETIKQRVPGWTLPKDYIALFDETAGLVFPERCIEQHIAIGTKVNSNAKVLVNTKVIKYETKQDGLIEVHTDKGVFTTKQLIISAGLWVNDFISDIKIPFVIQKNSVAWFSNVEDDKKIGKLPCFLVEYEEDAYVYGFPCAFGTGVKVGLHLEGPEYQHASQIDYNQDNKMYDKIREKVAPFLPTVASCAISKQVVCFYTRTPDDHFIIDFHPKNNNILILSPCSGHGFKFSSVIGEMAMDLLSTKKNPHDHFKISRFFPTQKL